MVGMAQRAVVVRILDALGRKESFELPESEHSVLLRACD